MPVAKLSAQTARTLLRRHPLLATKFYVPQLPPGRVDRLHLIEQLNRETHRPLTLITAPAGFGKTSLLAAWIQQSPWTFAWLSLDSQDNYPLRFWSHVAVAFQMLLPTLDASTLEALLSPDLASAESTLMALLNEMIAAEHDSALILEDYHVVTTSAIHEALAFLIDHLPPQVHIVIASRVEPTLPLTPMRARNQLLELRAADLRFTSEETREFFEKAVRIPLPLEQLHELDRHVEGWAAGLRLAALSMQYRANPLQFVSGITAETRYIGEYLTSEVLRRQPPEMQEFLLQTSILTQLNISLCNAVTGRQNSADMLKRPETDNLFLIALDNQQHW